MQLNDKQGWTIPVDSPFYPPLPAYYRNVRFQFIFFQDDQAAAAAFLPAPLKPAPNPLCDLSPLTPEAYLGAYYAEVSFAEGYAKIVHDYLAEN